MPAKATVTIEAKLEASSKDSLSISYLVRNLRSSKIYVFNVLFHADVQGNRKLDLELAYVIPQADHAVTVGKFLSPIPAGMKVESPEIPYLDPVEPGQALAGKLTLRLPLHPFRPYHPHSDTQVDLGANKLLIQIGFLDSSRAGPKDALIEPASGAGVGHFLCDYGLGLQYQELLTQEIAVRQPAR
jgi:hypothetical protein